MFGLKASPLRDSILASSRIYSTLHRSLFGLGEGAESPSPREGNHGASILTLELTAMTLPLDGDENSPSVTERAWRAGLTLALGITTPYIRSPCCHSEGKTERKKPRPTTNQWCGVPLTEERLLPSVRVTIRCGARQGPSLTIRLVVGWDLSPPYPTSSTTSQSILFPENCTSRAVRLLIVKAHQVSGEQFRRSFHNVLCPTPSYFLL